MILYTCISIYCSQEVASSENVVPVPDIVILHFLQLSLENVFWNTPIWHVVKPGQASAFWHVGEVCMSGGQHLLLTGTLVTYKPVKLFISTFLLDEYLLLVM